MPTHLLKTEPSEYSFSDLQRDRQTPWAGVRSPAGLKNLRAMAKGDALLIYHTGGERMIVGTAAVARAAYPDPDSDDPRHVVIDVKVGAPLPRPIALEQVKADSRFAAFDLVRQSRLSVMPVPDDLARVLQNWAGL